MLIIVDLISAPLSLFIEFVRDNLIISFTSSNIVLVTILVIFLIMDLYSIAINSAPNCKSISILNCYYYLSIIISFQLY
jgi:hypothetical protein